jgi:hypothetical protein
MELFFSRKHSSLLATITPETILPFASVLLARMIHRAYITTAFFKCQKSVDDCHRHFAHFLRCLHRLFRMLVPYTIILLFVSRILHSSSRNRITITTIQLISSSASAPELVTYHTTKQGLVDALCGDGFGGLDFVFAIFLILYIIFVFALVTF